jgi:hypothetical protein
MNTLRNAIKTIWNTKKIFDIGITYNAAENKYYFYIVNEAKELIKYPIDTAPNIVTIHNFLRSRIIRPDITITFESYGQYSALISYIFHNNFIK